MYVQEDQALKMLSDTAHKRTAAETALINHAVAKAQSARTSIVHRPSSRVLGSRQSLEMFGVADHGIVATRSKEPVGNGTKVYIN